MLNRAPFPKQSRRIGFTLGGVLSLISASASLACSAERETATPPATAGGQSSRSNPKAASASAALLPTTFSRGSTSYELAWLEEFDHGLRDATVGDWTFDANAAWLYPDNTRVSEGALKLRLTPRGDRVIKSNQAYLGAEYDRKGEQLYGRFMTRMRPSAPPGVIASFFTAFYKFDDQWNMLETAEIDIEFVGNTREVQFAIHFIDPQGEHQKEHQVVPLTFDAGAAFHVWEIEWLRDRVVYYVDDVEIHRFTNPTALAELRHPQAVRANTWISTSVPWAGAFDERSLPVESVYEWMAAYRVLE